jgi:glycerol uptake facilitator-like aquaporin
MEHSLPQKLLAEFVGTFTLIFIGAGSIIAAAEAGGGAAAALTYEHAILRRRVSA